MVPNKCGCLCSCDNVSMERASAALQPEHVRQAAGFACPLLTHFLLVKHMLPPRVKYVQSRIISVLRKKNNFFGFVYSYYNFLHAVPTMICVHREGDGSPQPERSAMSTMGFTRSQPSQSRLPSFSGLRSKASSSSSNNSGARAAPQRSGMSFGRRQPSFTREATPVRF